MEVEYLILAYTHLFFQTKYKCRTDVMRPDRWELALLISRSDQSRVHQPLPHINCWELSLFGNWCSYSDNPSDRGGRQLREVWNCMHTMQCSNISPHPWNLRQNLSITEAFLEQINKNEVTHCDLLYKLYFISFG